MDRENQQESPQKSFIKGYGERYILYRDGRLYSNYYKRFVKNSPTSRGYLKYSLSLNGETKQKDVHRLVAETFIINENPTIFTQVHHIDSNKHNNVVENLTWCTPSYNSVERDVYRGKSRSGHLSPEQINEIMQRFQSGEDLRKTSREMKISRGVLKRVLRESSKTRVRPRRCRVNKEEILNFHYLFGFKGYCTSKIASITGRDIETVKRHLFNLSENTLKISIKDLVSYHQAMGNGSSAFSTKI